jgi:sulfate adenylyltransferase subunit 2
MSGGGSHLSWLESEAIHIIREVLATAQNPVMLFSAGKDSTVMAHLAIRVFYPSKPPFPLLQVDSTREFHSLLAFRDAFAAEHGFELIAYANEEGGAASINAFDHGDRYTAIMRTEPLKAAVDEGGYDFIFGGAQRDEEKSRAKERIDSVRNTSHAWDRASNDLNCVAALQHAACEGADGACVPPVQLARTDIWSCALLNRIELAPLYYVASRPVVERSGAFIVVNDESPMRVQPGDTIQSRNVCLRTLGCWPVTGAIESDATDLKAVVEETLKASSSERQGRISNGGDGGSLEQKKREGYF